MGNALEHADEDDRLNRGKGDKLWTATVDLEKLIRTRRRALERAKKVKKRIRQRISVKITLKVLAEEKPR